MQETAASKVYNRAVVAAALTRLRGAALAAALSGWREAACVRSRLHRILRQVTKASKLFGQATRSQERMLSLSFLPFV